MDFSTLSMETDSALAKIDIPQVQCDHLSQSGSSQKKDAQKGMVTGLSESAAVSLGGHDEPLTFISGQRSDVFRLDFWKPYVFSRVVSE